MGGGGGQKIRGDIPGATSSGGIGKMEGLQGEVLGLGGVIPLIYFPGMSEG